MHRFVTFAALAASLLPAPLLAQPARPARPGLLESFAAETAFSSREDLARGDTPVSSASVTHVGFSLSGRRAIGTDTTFAFGIAAAVYELETATSLLPDRLVELSLNLGAQRRLSPQWSVAVYARPGLYGDFESSSRAFNVPLLALAQYAPRRELAWSFGLNTNPFSDNPVLPIVGLRWQFAPEWTFLLGFPRSEVTRTCGARLSLRAAMSVAGGNFRITHNRGVPAPGVRRLANTLLDYREIRAGIGADFKLRDALVLSADAGAVTDRKFDYIDRDYRLDGDEGLFVSLAIKRSY